jgi:GAF domain-containing protein
VTADPRLDALRALANYLVADAPVGDTLHRVAEITTDALPAAAMAGIAMLGEDGQPTTSVSTDPESPEIDQAQYGSGKGPCLDAWRQGRTIRVEDMERAFDDYPEFARAALDHGVRSTISFPMLAGDDSVGALNLYAREERAFDDDDQALGEELAKAAGSVLANASAYWAAYDLGEGLSQAMHSRAVIEQAKGILMGRTPTLDADAAFAVLRQMSQDENVKLRDIAQRIVDHRADEPD